MLIRIFLIYLLFLISSILIFSSLLIPYPPHFIPIYLLQTSPPTPYLSTSLHSPLQHMLTKQLRHILHQISITPQSNNLFFQSFFLPPFNRCPLQSLLQLSIPLYNHCQLPNQYFILLIQPYPFFFQFLNYPFIMYLPLL